MKTIHLFIVAILWGTFVQAQSLTTQLKQGDEYTSSGEYTKAIVCYKKILQTSTVQQGKALRMATLNSLALCYKQTGAYKEAADCYHQAFELAPPRSAAAFRLRLNLCELYLRMGLYQQVVDLLETEVPIEESDRMTRALHLSAAYGYLFQFEKAIALLQEEMTQTSGEKGKTYITLLANRGYLQLSSRQYKEAQSDLSQALSLTKSSQGKTFEQYTIMGNLALAEAHNGEAQQALAHIDSCLHWQQVHLGVSHPDYAITLRKKAEILLQLGQIPAATTQFKQYVQHEKEYIRRNFTFMTEKQRQDFWHSKRELIAESYATEGTDPEFLYGIALFDKTLLLQTNLDLEKQLEQNPTLKARFLEIKRMRQRLQNKALETKERDSLETSAQRKEEQLMRSLPSYKEYTQSFDRSTAALRKALKSPDEFAVEWIRYTKKDTVRYAALVLPQNGKCLFIPLCTENELAHYSLPHGRTLQEALYSENREDKNQLYTDSCLSRLIWEPLCKQLPNRCTLYFAADGLLHLLAIEYICPATQWKLFRLTSTGQLITTTQRPAPKAQPRALLFGGLDYDSEPERNYPEENEKSNEENLINRTASRVVGETGIRIAAKALVGTQVEIGSIRQSLQQSGVTCQVYTGKTGDEATFKKESSRYTLLHLATHGFCLDNRLVVRQPLACRTDSLTEDQSLSYSGILFSGVNQAIRPTKENEEKEDGILLAGEVGSLSLPQTKMAVLSACQTGLGRITSDGVFGMQRGFKKAGVETLVVSLWEVSDKATRLFMSAFYRYLSQGLAVHNAFLQAQTYLQNYIPPQAPAKRVYSPAQMRYVTTQPASSGKKLYNKPEYWAAFILLDGYKYKMK